MAFKVYQMGMAPSSATAQRSPLGAPRRSTQKSVKGRGRQEPIPFDPPGTFGTPPVPVDPVTGERIPEKASIGTSPIHAPRRTTLGESLADIRETGILPEVKDLTFDPIQTERAEAVQAGGVGNQLGDPFFKGIEEQATKNLQRRFFQDPDSLARQQQQQFNKRGLIGSGLEVAGQNQLFRDFGDELVDIQSNVAQQRAKAAQDVAFKNVDVDLANQQAANQIAQANAQAANQAAIESARGQLEAQAKTQEFNNFLADLGLRGAATESETASKFGADIFGEQVKLRESERKFGSDLLEQLNTALENKLIDKDTRQVFEDIFGANIGSILGIPETERREFDRQQAATDQREGLFDRIDEIDRKMARLPFGSTERQILERERNEITTELLRG
jgi:hypothetical protein|tara:strand:- start:10878 stop:12047 length:1170 start_codon:yes stop_codon:yes gene_type:complete